MARCIFIEVSNNSSVGQVYAPSEIVEVSSLPEWRRHIAIFVVLRWLTGEINQAFIDA